jgi:hypothetical protein
VTFHQNNPTWEDKATITTTPLEYNVGILKFQLNDLEGFNMNLFVNLLEKWKIPNIESATVQVIGNFQIFMLFEN